MQPRTDDQIRDDVVAALQDAANVDALAIEVTVHEGVVELRGELPSHSERLSATMVAKDAAAPAPIRSTMTVAPVARNFRLTDGDVAVEVGRALVHSEIPPGAISFAVNSRVVTLRGSVPDAEARTRVRHIVQAAAGVDFIDNQIVVQAATATHHGEGERP